MTLRHLIVSSCVAGLLAGCASGSGSEVGGTVLGAALGAALGAQVAGGSDRVVGAALGGALGAWLGHEIGRQIAEDDRRYHDRAAEAALWDSRYDRPQLWRNPQTGVHGEITPLSRSYRDRNGRVCRRFSDTIYYPDGGRRTVRGVACYDHGGWAVERWR